MARKLLLVLLIAFFLCACMLARPFQQALRAPAPTPASPSPSLVPSAPTRAATPTPLPLATQVIPDPQQPRTPIPGFPREGSFESNYTRIGESQHFEYFQDKKGYQPIEQAEWVRQAESIYAYVSRRLNLDVDEKIGVLFQPPDPSACPARGAAAGKFIIIYADEQTSQQQLQGVLAHELGHAIRSIAAPDLKPASLALEEGTATWAAGRYWTDWQGYASIDAMVLDYLQKTTYLPISQYQNLEGSQPDSPISGNCLTRRNILYTEWASFIAYLDRQYGREKLNALYQSGSVERAESKTVIVPPDYRGIYGLAINQLEAQWLASLQQDLTI